MGTFVEIRKERQDGRILSYKVDADTVSKRRWLVDAIINSELSETDKAYDLDMLPFMTETQLAEFSKIYADHHDALKREEAKYAKSLRPKLGPPAD